MVVLVSSFAPPPRLVLDPAPGFIAAVIDTVAETAVVVFDADLQDFAGDLESLIMDTGLNRWIFINGFSIDGNVISGTVEVWDDSVLGGVITYDGFPNDLIGVNGKPVENFEGVLLSDVPQPLSATYSVGGGWIDILFDRDVFINTATKTNFGAVVVPNTLNIQSVAKPTTATIRLGITINGPGAGPDRVLYDGQVDGIEDGSGNDVPLFEIGIDTIA